MMRKALMVACVLGGCATEQPAPTTTAQQYFTLNVYPVLVHSCSGNTSGCHAQGGAVALALDDGADATYAALVPAYSDTFTDTSILLPSPHAGGGYDATVSDVIEAWFARERAERGLP